jgi:hypothetical protein
LSAGPSGDEWAGFYFPILNDFFELPKFPRNFFEGGPHKKEVCAGGVFNRYLFFSLYADVGDLVVNGWFDVVLVFWVFK